MSYFLKVSFRLQCAWVQGLTRVRMVLQLEVQAFLCLLTGTLQDAVTDQDLGSENDIEVKDIVL